MEKILVADDDTGILFLIKKNLRREDFDIETVETGAEALSKTLELKPSLLILDYILKDMNCRQIIETLQSHNLRIPFIIMTGHGDEKVAVDLMKLGARDYIIKDQNFLSLLPAIVKQVMETIIYEQKLKIAETALIESESRYRTLVENSRDIIFTVDENACFTFINQTFEKETGFSINEMLHRNCFDLIHPSDRKMMNELFKMLSNDQPVPLYELKLLKSNQEDIFVELGMVGIKDANQKIIGTLGIGRNVTQRKSLEQQLLQSQKMEAIGRLAGGVAHDFNNILTAIIGQADLLALDAKEKDLPVQEIEQIRSAAERAASLTRQLLAFSRKQMLQPQIVDINRIIEDIHKMLRRVIGEDIAINVVVDRNLSKIKADKGQIEQVIMNLMMNARDAMPHGGSLSILVNNVEIHESYKNLESDIAPGRFISIAVKDTGVGIESSVLPHIFEPFFTTKEINRGTGLGLSVVYGIVKQHKGWIEVESQLGTGTEFKVFLPAIIEDSSEADATGYEMDDLKGRGERVLFVEDETSLRDVIFRALKAYGYRVFEAKDATEAMTIFEAEKRDFDLVFSDVVLPDENGIDLVGKLLAIKPELKVLLTTGYVDEKSQWSKIQDNHYSFVQKPYQIYSLLQKIKEILHR